MCSSAGRQDSTVGRGLRRSCGGDQATQNILRDGALATMLGEGIAKVCVTAPVIVVPSTAASSLLVGFRVLDVERNDKSRK